MFSHCSLYLQNFLGLETLTQEMTHGLPWFEEESKENILVALQQMFPASADKKEDEVESLTKSYQKYNNDTVNEVANSCGCSWLQELYEKRCINCLIEK